MSRRPKKHPGGRPPVAGETRGTVLPPIRMTNEERARAVAEAEAHGATLSEWTRRRIVHDGADPR